MNYTICQNYTLDSWIPYENQCSYVNNLLLTTKQNFYCNKINENADDQKAVFGVINKLLHRNPETNLPSHDSPEELANHFVDFFSEKITMIRQDLLSQQSPTTDSDLPTQEFTSAKLTDFASASEKEIETLIKQSASKSFSLDPIPTWLLKQCLDILLPIITKIVNLSLSSSHMPDNLKEAILIPLLKKYNLDYEILKNFRPISNLEYLAKLIEKVVAARVTEHMQTHHLHETLQSAYK